MPRMDLKLRNVHMQPFPACVPTLHHVPQNDPLRKSHRPGMQFDDLLFGVVPDRRQNNTCRLAVLR